MPMRVITDRIGVSELFVDETLTDAEHPLYFHHRTVAPGGRAHAAHTHGPDAEQVECFFVIEGEAEVQIEDEVRRLHAGQGAVINTRRRHGFRNAGDGPLRYLVMTAPGPPPANAIGRAPAPGESGRG
jgi:mannose-6-phosphate isomerase-like protein (cupin superfamily)